MYDELRKKLREDYDRYFSEYKFWNTCIVDEESRRAFGTAAAQYYGMICALINMERELLGEHELADKFGSIPPIFADRDSNKALND